MIIRKTVPKTDLYIITLYKLEVINFKIPVLIFEMH